MDVRFPFSPAETAKVRTVQFGILSPDEIVINFLPLGNSCRCLGFVAEPVRGEVFGGGLGFLLAWSGFFASVWGC